MLSQLLLCFVLRVANVIAMVSWKSRFQARKKVPFPWVSGQHNQESRCVPLVQCSINFTK